jgi:two-component system LytT family sensor kinase
MSEDAALPAPRRGPRWWAAYTLGWLALIALFTAQNSLYGVFQGRGMPLSRALLYPVLDGAYWLLISPLVLLLADRVPFARGRRGRALLVHVPAAIALSALNAVTTTPVLFALGVMKDSGMTPPRLVGALLVGKLQANLLTYAAIVFLAHALEERRRRREEELRASRLVAGLSQARLQLLEIQLQPHFLFNALNTVSSLMRRDVEAADRVLARLGDLLRLAIRPDGAQEVPLEEELSFLDGYVEIQQARFGDRLRVERDIAPETRAALLPRLVLQPLVENAIRHGVGPRATGGRIMIAARRAGDALVLTVTDDGLGLATGAPEGVGVANTRARLLALYAGAGSFALVAVPAGGGTEARLTVPWHTNGTAE